MSGGSNKSEDSVNQPTPFDNSDEAWMERIRRAQAMDVEDDTTSSEKEIPPPEMNSYEKTIDQQERTIVGAVLKMVGMGQEARRQQKALEKERRDKERLQAELDALKKSLKDSNDGAGSSRASKGQKKPRTSYKKP